MVIVRPCPIFVDAIEELVCCRSHLPLGSITNPATLSLTNNYTISILSFDAICSCKTVVGIISEPQNAKIAKYDLLPLGAELLRSNK
jgi:hypothetical protein